MEKIAWRGECHLGQRLRMTSGASLLKAEKEEQVNLGEKPGEDGISGGKGKVF